MRIRLGNAQAVDDACAKAEWSERRCFASPNGKLMACWHSPFEFRMGADTWQLDLEDDEGRAITEHPFLREGNMFVETSRPWSCDSRRLAVAKWTERPPLLLYDVRDRTCVPLPKVEENYAWIRAIECSPHGPRCGLIKGESLLICNLDGHVVAAHAWMPFEQTDYRFMRWLPSVNALFVIGRRNRKGDEIVFYEGDTGAELTCRALSPHDLVPYDFEAYQRVSRTRFSLQTGRGSWSVGSLLDTWSAVEFDESASVLRLQVFRPTGPQTQDEAVAGMAGKGAWGCSVEPKCVVVPILVG